MALIDISKIANRRAVVSSAVVEQGQKYASYPFMDFISRLGELLAEEIDEYYARLSRILLEDLKNEEDSVLYKMVKEVYSDLSDENVNAMLGRALTYINIDNCIRIKFTPKGDLAQLITKTISYEKDLFGDKIKETFRNIVLPYIRDYVNPKLEFTKMDERFYLEEDVDFGLYSSGYSSLYSIDVHEYLIPVSTGKDGEIMTYFLPEHKDGNITYGGYKMIPENLKNGDKGSTFGPWYGVKSPQNYDTNSLNAFKSLWADEEMESLRNLRGEIMGLVSDNLGFDTIPERVVSLDDDTTVEKAFSTDAMSDKSRLLKTLPGLRVRRDYNEDVVKGYVLGEDLFGVIPFSKTSNPLSAFPKESAFDISMFSFEDHAFRKGVGEDADKMFKAEENLSICTNWEHSLLYIYGLGDKFFPFIIESLERSCNGAIRKEALRIFAEAQVELKKKIELVASDESGDSNKLKFDHTPITKIIRDTYTSDKGLTTTGTYRDCDGYIMVSMGMKRKARSVRKFKQLFQGDMMTLTLSYK